MAQLQSERRSRRLSRAVVLSTILVVAFAASLRAQVVSDPRIAEFDPSPDHWTVLESGQPAVERYELNIYSVASSVLLATVDLGKPAPDADGKIRFDFTTVVANWSFGGGEYEARVSAVGPEGAALSDASNPFTFTPSSECTYSLSHTTMRAPAAGGSYSGSVSAATTCGWTATTSLPWVSLWVTSGTGNGTVPFQVQANTSTSNRSGTITIAGQAVTFLQSGAAAPASTFAKASPANGTTAQSSSVTLTWSAVTDAGYWVCWDTTNNNRCDGAWMPNGGGPGRTLTGLASRDVLLAGAGPDNERRDRRE